jgi:hypothetical protein
MPTQSPPATTRDIARMGYILSASHSGSTLLAMLLGAQPGACTVGELRAPSMGDADKYQCSCGQKIKLCPFWEKVSETMARKGIQDFDITNARTSIFEIGSPYAQRLLEPLQRGPVLEWLRDRALAFSSAWRPHLAEVRQRNVALVQTLQELTSAEIVIDSSKSVLHLKYLLQNAKLQIKVLWLIRDGRAVTLSLIGHGLKRETRLETVAAAAREWRRSNEAAESLVATLPASQCIRLNYEDLCRDPETRLRQLCEFIELDCDSLNLNFRSGEQHVLGNEMRLNSTSQIRLDERWRTQLSNEDLQVFDEVAGPMNRQYGYK